MENVTRTLAGFAARLAYPELPPALVGRLKTCLLDAIGCGLHGAGLPWADIVNRWVMRQGGPPEATLWRQGFRGPCANVALGLGVMVHGFDFDDYHNAKIHPGAPVIPAALTVGEWLGTSGREVLAAMAAGPLRGQNNVQGACDMGGLPDVFSGYQKVADEAARRRMAAAWGVDALPAMAGMKVTQMIPAAHAGKLKAMYIIGENPLVSDPDLNHAEKSFETLDFLVVQDIFLTETAQQADVVLPATCYAEKEGTFSNTERRVQRVRQAVEPPGEARDDWRILCDIAARMGRPMAYAESRDIMEEIRRVTPSYAGIGYERIEQEGIHWPCPNPEHPGTPVLHRDQFTSGKGVFHAIEFVPPAETADRDYPLYLTTGRVLYQYHTGTMTMKTGGLNEIAPECFVEISSEDARAYALQDGGRVAIASRRGRIQARIHVSPKAVAGTVFLPFHYARAAANRLTNAALDPVSGIPEFKVCAVRLEKAA